MEPMIVMMVQMKIPPVVSICFYLFYLDCMFDIPGRIYVFSQPLHHKLNQTQGWFLSRMQQVRIQSFPFILVDIARLKNPAVEITFYAFQIVLLMDSWWHDQINI